MSAPNEHILEIRFEPNSKILDYRGRWAETIATKLGLPHWRIIENRLDVHDKDNERQCFVSFRNMGMTAKDTPTKSFFIDQAVKFLRVVLALDGISNPLPVQRLGVRGKFCDSFDGTFNELRERFLERYVGPTPEAMKAIAPTKILDIGAPLNFEDEVGTCHTHCGPVSETEAKSFFGRNTGFTAVGLYYDIDYFRLRPVQMTPDDLTKAVTALGKAAWERHERIWELLSKA